MFAVMSLVEKYRALCRQDNPMRPQLPWPLLGKARLHTAVASHTQEPNRQAASSCVDSPSAVAVDVRNSVVVVFA